MAAELVINNFQQGIGVSPYTGFAQMTNVDIYSEVGSLKISNILAVDANSSSIVTGLLKWAASDPQNGDVYAVDDSGKVYKRDNGTSTWSVITGNGTSGANGNGLGIWKDYLFVARNTRLDVYGPLNGGPSWTNNWQTLTSHTLHPIMAAQDDFLYIGDAWYVSTLEETFPAQPLPFDPNLIATYTYNSQILPLRSDYRVTCLDEQGSLIVIGTAIHDDINVADIFIWDGTSSTTSNNGTIHLVENGVKQMKNVDNTIFASAGNSEPRIFQAVTSQSKEVKRFNNITVPFSRVTQSNPGAIEYKEGEILFGVGSNTGSVNPLGVYALRNGAYVLRYLISTGNDGSTGTLRIGLVKTISRNEILVSWRDSQSSQTYGVDILTDKFYTGYAAYVDSPIYSVATDDDPVTFEKCEIKMGKALKAGDKVKVQARYDLTGTFTDIVEFDTVAIPALIGRSVIDNKVSNLGYFKNFQARILLDTDANATVSPELMSVTLR